MKWSFCNNLLKYKLAFIKLLRGFKTLNLAKKVVLGLCICGVYSNSVCAAPADHDQQQQAKRQSGQQAECQAVQVPAR